jgi:hypothetical protein
MIDIISIHIAKTGGRTFYEILKNEYADALDSRTKRTDYFPDKDYSNALISRIPEHIHVIHGHLHYKHIEDIHNEQKPKIIAWLREPVDRIISNYYYMIGRVNEVGESHPQYRKRNHTLIEYAHDSVINKMNKCLDGLGLEGLYFFGFQESFDEDVKALARKLNWQKEIPALHLNTGDSFDVYESAPTKKQDITASMRDEIAALNQKDILLYKQALAMKQS